MTTYRLNTRLLLATGVLLLLGVAGSVSLHGWQIRRHAREQESLANLAREKSESRAEMAHLFRWLSFEPDADEARTRHALVLSREAKNSRDRARALYTLKQALINDSTSETLRLRTAELALENGDAGDALQLLNPLLEREAPRAEWFELTAKCHLANQNEANARTALRRALEIAPNHFETATQLVELLEKDPQQSRPLQSVLYQLVKANPRAVQAWLIRARVHMRKGEWEKASLDLIQARAAAPRDIDALLLSAEVAGRLNKTDEAILFRKQALKEQPTNAALYLSQARDEKAQGKTDAAIATLRAGSKEVPYNSDLYFLIADLLIEKGETAEANEWLGRLPETQAPGRIAFIKGRQAIREKKWLEAAERFAEALPEKDLLPEDRQQLLLNLANCYGQLGAGDEQYLATALAAQTRNDPQSLLRQAQWLTQAGRGSEAIPLLENLSRMPAPPPGTWPLLARVLMDRNRLLPLAQRRWPEVDQAVSRLEKDAATRRLAPPLRAEMLELRRQPTEAKSLLEKDLKDHPKDLSSYLALADLLQRLEEAPAAQDVLLQGDKAFPGSLSWLQARASRIVSAGSGDILEQLKALEERGKDLGETERNQLDRTLVEWYARLHFHKEVERLANALLKKDLQDVRLRQLLVDACLSRRDEAGAQKWIEQIRKIEGEKGLGWREASVALELDRAERGQKAGLKSARKWLEEILQQRPNWTQAAYLLGRLADLEQKPEEALAAYRRSLAGAEPHPLALSRTIRLLTERKRWTEALVMVEKALRLGQLDRLARRDAAWIALRAGRPDRARELAFAVVPLEKSRALDLLWLGRLLAAAGFETEATEAFLRAQTL
ncbi:MAG: tetratricopeptide repeat protein, partial [Gemmataceae bacterium]